MSAAPVSAQEISNLYTEVYSILIYDWLLCLGQEVRFIWNWRSKVTSSSLVYALSRYAMLIEFLLAVATAYPMSDLLIVVDWVEIHLCSHPLPHNSCRANVWTQAALEILGTIAFSTFSALRAYALSNRNMWLSAIIILLALPSMVMNTSIQLRLVDLAIPDALSQVCSTASILVGSTNHPAIIILSSVNVVWRGSQLAAELLVVGITWWYSYQSYRIRKGINLGKTISSLLIYNGSLYFLFLATLYVLEIIFATASVADTVSTAAVFLEIFYDPITSILMCRFMLELRQFDTGPASLAFSETGSRLREHTASRDVLQFAALPSDSLPPFLTSFAGPVHVDSALSETDPDAFDDDGMEWQEMDVIHAPTLTTRSSQPESPTPEQPKASDLGHSV
ncbi:hypothetical protein LXA43DRAFT_1101438 [Ganoderma leucocontextum]|nr:hypothetical protein LXA43DRAFT_1101438 [Ganoderma leucocontextum]